MFGFNFENVNSGGKINKEKIVKSIGENGYKIVEGICMHSQERVRKTVDAEIYTLSQIEKIQNEQAQKDKEQKEKIANSVISEKDRKLQEIIMQAKGSDKNSSVTFHTMQQSKQNPKPKQRVSRIQGDVNKAVEEQLKLLGSTKDPKKNMDNPVSQSSNISSSSGSMSQDEIDALIKRMAS